MDDRYVLGFAPALRFLRSQIMCRLYKSPSDETISRGSRVYTHAKRLHTHHEDPLVHFRVRWTMKTSPSIQSTKIASLQSVGHFTEEEQENISENEKGE